MEDFITNQQKISIANKKFLDLCRNNQSDWVTCNQAGIYQTLRNLNNFQVRYFRKYLK